MPIRAVTLDLWETLVAHTPENDRAILSLRYERIQTALGRTFRLEQFREAYRLSWEKFEEIWTTNREVQTEEQLEIFLTLLFDSTHPALDAETKKKLVAAYLSPVREGTLWAETEVVKQGRNIAFTESKVWDHNARLVATASGSMFVFRNA